MLRPFRYLILNTKVSFFAEQKQLRNKMAPPYRDVLVNRGNDLQVILVHAVTILHDPLFAVERIHDSGEMVAKG